MNKDFIYRLVSICFRALPLRKKTVLFTSYYGAQYGCNPKYLSQFFVQNYPEWNITWGFTDPEAYTSVPVRKVRYLSLRFLYELATCQVFVTNYRMPAYYKRRKGQLYVQTWHSSLRLKAIEADAGPSVPESYIQMAKNDSQQISLLLSGCEKSTEIFRRAFWYDGEILPSGTPRIDLLVSRSSESQSRIRQKLGMDEEVHLVLYAPTFREHKAGNPYDINLENLLDSLRNKWGGNWMLLLRLHPHLRNDAPQWMSASVPLLDVTSYDDIQELLCISDVVISDYSSLVFDFAYTGRPCFLYTPDLEAYLEKERNLYFIPKDLPFPIIHDNGEWEAVISAFDEKGYLSRVEAFLKETGSYETGHACERVCQAIMKRLS
jgi:CDP-glycerol glycerophosphotransferase